ncbi:glycosyl transferase [Rhizobium sp. NLR9b]|uniref:GH36-type glycosyl hydrolase domain-containing protein n=1 Tax=unclassified Rhizobium TaxID=2613769 RepID=UPI001C83010B|nr:MULTISPECIES: glycosyl transferase [unclassified Rhizobium]MBX5226258.1 glycosyl transferase [Rhizobium sp. NLR9b]MBX5286931.1 glycosyl transferase [Rhizobium sp. NLR10b]
MARLTGEIEDVGEARPAGAPPEITLLSNGRYSVLLTESGSGYGSWLGLDVTRWREDGTRDCWGQFCYVRDLEDGKVWSIARQPVCRADADYQHSFPGDRAEFRCSAGDIEISWEVCVAADHDAELRLLRLFNRGAKARELELTSYSEICLNGRRADSAHPAFAKLFVETWFVAETTALFARRRPRSGSEKPVWAVHVSASSDDTHPAVGYDTDRYRFLGRGRTPSNPGALERGGKLTGTTGPVLDPIFSLRRTVRLEPSGTETIAFVTGAADSEAGAAAIAERFATIDAVVQTVSDAKERHAAELASSKLSPATVAAYNRLAGSLAFSNPGLRYGGAPVKEGLTTEGLWSLGISGDLPILLLRMDQADQKSLVEEIIAAHAFITSRGLPFDLALLDEAGAGEAVDRSQVAETLGKAGGIHLLSAAAISSASADALAAAARVVLYCSKGTLAGQVETPAATMPKAREPMEPSRGEGEKPRAAARGDLLFWNGCGGFTPDGREYVIAADGEAMTPMPWCNVIANPAFGCLTSESGLGYSWAGNSQLNRLTPWANDPVSDPPGEVVYFSDEQTGEFWTPTLLPLGHSSSVTASHGQGYSRYESTHGSLRQEMTVHVPDADPVKIVHLAIRNNGTDARRLTATYFVEWVLGTLRETAAGRIECEIDGESGAIVARNLWDSGFSGKLAFIASSAPPRSFTCDRREFLGINGSVSRPAGLEGSRLGGSVGCLLDPCAALMVEMTVPPGQGAELVFVLGQAGSRDEVRRLARDYAEPAGARRSQAIVSRQWDELLGSVTVRTPDAAFDLMMNRWLIYQVLSCRVWARTGFYQSGGAYGFRDQLQDVAALVHCAPDETRAHILRAAARQFTEGDVQHWWHPPSGVGVRTRMTDDLYFLPYVVQHYVSTTGDHALLDERVSFVTSPPLSDDQEESFGVPRVTEENGTLYDHCCRALDRGLRLGAHGLPLIGTGDWNDGMNKVGAQGKGESVWNGWFFLTVLRSFATIASARGDEERVAWCLERAEALRASLEAEAWDGSWYRRAYFDDGTPLGSHLNDECQIDAIPQAWAVISGVADAGRASTAMQAVWERLVRPEDKLIQLFHPPFDKGTLQPGYIKGYVPGIRENGGQYTHAAAWVALATAMLGEADRAFELWSMLNPINHSLSAEDAARYMVEPYVVSADVYGAFPHTGRGGWTWYTGSASWLYRVGLEAILGIRRQGDQLSVQPCIPSHWPGYEADLRFGSATYSIKVRRDPASGRGHRLLSADGEDLTAQSVPLEDDGKNHQIQLVMG